MFWRLAALWQSDAGDVGRWKRYMGCHGGRHREVPHSQGARRPATVAWQGSCNRDGTISLTQPAGASHPNDNGHPQARRGTGSRQGTQVRLRQQESSLGLCCVAAHPGPGPGSRCCGKPLRTGFYEFRRREELGTSQGDSPVSGCHSHGSRGHLTPQYRVRRPHAPWQKWQCGRMGLEMVPWTKLGLQAVQAWCPARGSTEAGSRLYSGRPVARPIHEGKGSRTQGSLRATPPSPKTDVLRLSRSWQCLPGLAPYRVQGTILVGFFVGGGQGDDQTGRSDESDMEQASTTLGHHGPGPGWSVHDGGCVQAVRSAPLVLPSLASDPSRMARRVLRFLQN